MMAMTGKFLKLKQSSSQRLVSNGLAVLIKSTGVVTSVWNDDGMRVAATSDAK